MNMYEYLSNYSFYLCGFISRPTTALGLCTCPWCIIHQNDTQYHLTAVFARDGMPDNDVWDLLYNSVGRLHIYANRNLL